MLRSDYEGQNCSIARALEIVGERWTLLIVRDIGLGLRRFDQLQESLGIARPALRQWGDTYVSKKPPLLLRRKSDKKPVIAALVPKGTPVLRPGEVETVPGPGSTPTPAARNRA